MATVRGGLVLPHVQAFANDLQNATGVSSFGTYPAHSIAQNRAIDIFHGVGDHAASDAICDFYVKNWKHYGGDYIISRKRIWNPEINQNWRNMSDRGGITQNHEDHAHVSFEHKGNASAPVPTTPPPGDTIPAWPGRYFRLPPGTRGEDVARWQNRMKVRGWNITVDGDYGPQSSGAARSFQADKGLEVDGIVGPETWRCAWDCPVT